MSLPGSEPSRGGGPAEPPLHPVPMQSPLPGADPFPEDLVRRLAAASEPLGPDHLARTRHLKEGRPLFTNRLALEKSPYLLQHAHNPVSWYPWGDEAFEVARRTGRPVFLSVGYSTCHWCHVMERESFEDLEIARVLNSRFVPVKVDREERPDVDAVYMTAVQLLTGGGGWPMSVWLTPDREPFFGGTYFPPHDRRARVPAWLPGGPRGARRRVGGRAIPGGGGRAARSPRRSAPRSSPGESADAPPGPGPIARAVELVSAGLRRPPRRDRGARPSSPPTSRSGSSSATTGATGDAALAPHGDLHPGAHGGGRHPRPGGRRVPPLLDRRRLARPALREDALRQRAAGGRATPRPSRSPAGATWPAWRARRSTTCCAR